MDTSIHHLSRTHPRQDAATRGNHSIDLANAASLSFPVAACVVTTIPSQDQPMPERDDDVSGVRHSPQGQGQDHNDQEPNRSLFLLPWSRLEAVRERHQASPEFPYRENEISDKNYVFSNFFATATTMADDVVDINTGSSGHGDGRGILLPVAISQSQNDNLQSPSFRSPSPPLDPNPLMPALRRKSTGGYMSPPPRRAHPYKSSRPLIKPRANFALSLNRCSPGVRQSSPQQQQYQPHHRQQSQQPTSGFRSPAALPDLRYLDQKLEHLQHLQQQQQQQQQGQYRQDTRPRRAFSESDLLPADGPSSSKPIPIDARNEPVEASMAAAVVPASPFAIAFAVATMTPTTSPVVRVDDVHNNKRPSPYPFETHNTNMTNQFGDHQEDHDSELDQSDDMDEIISEKAPEEHERDLNRARAEIELAKEQYKEAYSKLRDAQERENAILFEQDMQLRIDEDRFHKQQTQQQQQQQQQQQPSSSFSERVGTAARPSEMRLFSEGLGSQRSSFSPALSTTGTSFSQGFMSFVQHRPEIQPPSPSLVRDIQLQQQQREASRPSEEVVRSGNDTGHEVEDSRARVVPQVDDTPLTYLHGRQQQQQQQQQFFPVNSPSVLPTRIKTEEQDVKPSRPQQQQHQQFWPRGRGWYRDYIVPIEIPSSVGSVSEERAAEDIHNDDANHGLVSGIKRASTPMPFLPRKRGPSVKPFDSHRHHHHHSHQDRTHQGQTLAHSPRIKSKSSRSPFPPPQRPQEPSPMMPPRTPGVDTPRSFREGSIASFGSYPSPSASRIQPQYPQKQPYQHPQTPQQPHNNDINNRQSLPRVATPHYQHHQEQQYRRHQEEQQQFRRDPQPQPQRPPSQPPQQSQQQQQQSRHHRQQHQYHQLHHSPLLNQFVNSAMGGRGVDTGVGGSSGNDHQSSNIPPDPTTFASSAAAAAAQGMPVLSHGGLPVVYYTHIGRVDNIINHHYHYPSPPTMPKKHTQRGGRRSSSAKSGGRSFENEMEETRESEWEEKGYGANPTPEGGEKRRRESPIM